MLRLIQVYNTVKDKELFVDIFDDLSFELHDLGYIDYPEDLIDELLVNHFGISFECPRQLKDFTNDIMRYQGKLSSYLNTIKEII